MKKNSNITAQSEGNNGMHQSNDTQPLGVFSDITGLDFKLPHDTNTTKQNAHI